MIDFATYVGVRDAFLDGDLALAECAARLEQLELTPAERREWDRLVAVEDELARLVETAGDLPWTALRVENELQQRVRAAQWLRQNPRGVLGIGGLGSNGTELRRGLVQAGVAAGGASCAMLCCCLVLQVCLPPGPQPGALTLAAGLGGLLALAALRWAELRSYYTS
jgi:hypothetical protein